MHTYYCLTQVSAGLEVADASAESDVASAEADVGASAEADVGASAEAEVDVSPVADVGDNSAGPST